MATPNSVYVQADLKGTLVQIGNSTGSAAGTTYPTNGTTGYTVTWTVQKIRLFIGGVNDYKEFRLGGAAANTAP